MQNGSNWTNWLADVLTNVSLNKQLTFQMNLLGFFSPESLKLVWWADFDLADFVLLWEFSLKLNGKCALFFWTRLRDTLKIVFSWSMLRFAVEIRNFLLENYTFGPDHGILDRKLKRWSKMEFLVRNLKLWSNNFSWWKFETPQSTLRLLGTNNSWSVSNVPDYSPTE